MLTGASARARAGTVDQGAGARARDVRQVDLFGARARVTFDRAAGEGAGAQWSWSIRWQGSSVSGSRHGIAGAVGAARVALLEHRVSDYVRGRATDSAGRWVYVRAVHVNRGDVIPVGRVSAWTSYGDLRRVDITAGGTTYWRRFDDLVSVWRA